MSQIKEEGSPPNDNANKDTLVVCSSSDGVFSHTFSASLKNVSETEPMEWMSVATTQQFSPRVGHILVSSRISGSLRLYMLGGGNHDGDIKELWEVDVDSSDKKEGCSCPDWKLNSASQDFSGRYEFAAALNPSGDKLWMFGGADCSQPRNDVCYLDLENTSFVEKFQVTPASAEVNEKNNMPSARTQGGNSCLLEIGDKTYMAVYGGGVKGEHAVPDGNLYLFDIDSCEWERVDVTGDTPGKRQGHGMISIGSKIYIHGGMHEFQIYDDLYLLDLSEMRSKAPTWRRIRGGNEYPVARAAHGILRDDQDILVFGGLGNEGALGDLWKFSSESMEWTEIKTGPMRYPRLDSAMTVISADDNRKVLLVHGGMNTEGTIFNDFWAVRLS